MKKRILELRFQTNEVLKMIQKRIQYSILIFLYVVFRFGLFYLHGMKEFPTYLTLVTFIFLVLFNALNQLKASSILLMGYGLGFLNGFLFNKDSFDPGGGRLNNFWLIWLLTTLIFLTFASIHIHLKKRNE